MAVDQGFKPYISVMMASGNPCSSLCITIAGFPPFPSGWTTGFLSLNTHKVFATVKGSHNLVPMYTIRLSPAKSSTPKWEACLTIRVVSEWIPPKLTVSFRGCSKWEGTQTVKIGVKEATFCGMPKVSWHDFLRCISIPGFDQSIVSFVPLQKSC